MLDVALLLGMIIALALVSLKITKDLLNPALLAAIGIYLNFTLNGYPLSELQESPLSEAYKVFYWGGLISLVLFPLLLVFLARREFSRKSVFMVEKPNRFARLQWAVVIVYIFFYMLHNYLLSRSLVPLLFSARDVHHLRIPILDSIVIPALGVFVFFEGLAFNSKAGAYIRTALFILVPVTSGSRLIPVYMFCFFIAGYISGRGRLGLSAATKFTGVIAVAVGLLFAIGLYRSGTRGLEIGYSEVWGLQLSGIPIIDDFFAFYWRYFITTFANFNELTIQTTPAARYLDLWVYPLAQFLQFDNLLGMASITDKLAVDFTDPLANVPSIVSFFGPPYLYGGIVGGGAWVAAFGFCVTAIYVRSRKSVSASILYAPFAVTFMMGSFVNMFLSGTFLAYVLALLIASRAYHRNGILVVSTIRN